MLLFVFLFFSYFFFFFFQAEDGIRDHCVTGVQTCALPISQTNSTRQSCLIFVHPRTSTIPICPVLCTCVPPHGCSSTRSEEHTSELQSHSDLVCRLLLVKKKKAKLWRDPSRTCLMPGTVRA